MTKDEVVKYLIKPICTSTIESEEYRKQLEAYTTAVESLNCGEEKRMKEYIVHPPKSNLLAVEEYSTFYGEPVKELIRCKDCKHWSPIMLGGCGYCNLTDENYIEKADGYCCHAEKWK